MKIAPIAAALALAASLAAGSAAAQEGHTRPKAESGGAKDWTSHKGNIPFIIGREAGMKEAEFTGKPILFFYTATW
jgi:cytochrome oxidase Cu insertion factor (SCO1/SenC/PrrC family)